MTKFASILEDAIHFTEESGRSKSRNARRIRLQYPFLRRGASSNSYNIKGEVASLGDTGRKSLNDILQTSDDTQYYIFDKSFEGARDEPHPILHSSGSTGDPKLVTMTHGTFAVTDNDRNMPTPRSRRPQNAARFDFGGGENFSCAFHNITATVVFGPAMLLLSDYLLSKILKHQHVRSFYVPPLINEQWSAEPTATGQAKNLDFVLYGSEPLSPQIGNALSDVTDVC
ncbi:hypothetical protein BGZ60DRAFT_526911 [Tricladium varicosporioides]|nr:hypothetical protein BGZ60DRAFT_526911 [Hymenoscyphus varicosporioides]